MRYGCCTSGLTGFMGLPEAVEEIALNGFDFAEINTAGFISGEEKELISKTCRKTGIYIHLHVNLNYLRAAAERAGKEFPEYIDERISGLLEWPANDMVRQISFDPVYGHLVREKSGRYFIGAGKWKLLHRTAAVLGMRGILRDFRKEDTLAALEAGLDKGAGEVALENLTDGTTSREDIEYIFSGLGYPPWFGMLLDVGHLNIIIGQDVYEYISSFPFRIWGFHLSNNNGRYDSHGGLRAGTVDYHKILDILIEQNYNNSVSLEITASTLNSYRLKTDEALEILKGR